VEVEAAGIEPAAFTWNGVRMHVTITFTRSEEVCISITFLAGDRVEYSACTVSIEKVASKV
jgi:hypothetical protein